MSEHIRRRLRSARFLIVEDDAKAAASLERVLLQCEVTAHTAVSSQACLERLQSQRPYDGAVVEQGLLSGVSLLRTLRRTGCCPVVIGELPVDHRVREVVAEGAFHFLEKPFSVEEFLSAAAEAAQIGQRWKQLFRGAPVRTSDQGFVPLEPRILQQRLAEWDTLSMRERQVLARVVLGWTNREVAEDLGLSVSSVKYHDLRGRTRLSVHSRRQLTRLVLEGARSIDSVQDED